jgi:hypothetical protein
MATTFNANLGRATLSSGNSTVDGSSGTINVLLTGASFGTLIQQVVIAANVSLGKYGMIRFFIHENGAGSNDWNLLKEVPTDTTQQQTSGQFQLFSRIVTFGNMYLPAGASLGVTTENSDAFQITAFGLDITGWT